MRNRVTLALLLVSFQPLPLALAAETQYFEKTLSEAGKTVGKKLDQVKVKTQEIATQTKKDLSESLDEAKKDTKDASNKLSEKIETDWSHRIKAAAKEFSLGVGRAWNQLRGQND